MDSGKCDRDLRIILTLCEKEGPLPGPIHHSLLSALIEMGSGNSPEFLKAGKADLIKRFQI